MARALIAVVGLGAGAIAASTSEMHPVASDYRQLLARSSRAFGPTLFRRPTTAPCRAFYERLFSGSTIDVRIALGYLNKTADEGPLEVGGRDYGLNYVLDGHAADALADWVVRDCAGTEKLCGLERDAIDPDLFTKTIERGEAEVRLRLRLTHAAASPRNERNAPGGDLQDEQRLRTVASERVFFGGLREADVVVYVGHARGGGGPDFAPPVLRPNGHVDYNGYYRVELPGITKLVQVLSEAPRPAQVVGLIGCKTAPLFVDRHGLGEIAPGTLFVTADEKIGYESMLFAGTALIDSLLNELCLDEIWPVFERARLGSNGGTGGGGSVRDLISFQGALPQ